MIGTSSRLKDESKRETLILPRRRYGATMVASIAGAQSEESSKEIRAALTGGRIKPLSFDPAVLNGPSEKLIRSHWENN